MPKIRRCWASWAYLSETLEDRKSSLSLTYWMNNLQGLPGDVPVFVTLNPGRPPAAGSQVYDRHSFKHPVFTLEALRAQGRVASIQNKNRTSFCGAWQRYGFHEDGLMSAVMVAENLGCGMPWK
jgi:predicted NAD/FAD-binding protein